MHLIDLSHTSHTLARTGIQRVARSLRRELANNVEPITWDPHAGRWRTLAQWEQENLQDDTPGRSRGARWPFTAKLQGRVSRWLPSPPPITADGGLIVPEVFSPEVAAAFPRLAVGKPRIALFHDAIALKLPELTPPGTVARFPAYLQELLSFDGIAAVSEDSRDTLLAYWSWLGVRQPPPVECIPLGVDPCDPLLPPADHAAGPTILCVGTIEGRKNHLALLDACETLWSQGHRFTLQLIGMTHAHTGASALRKIHELQAKGRPVRSDGAVSDAALHSAYAECAFTVYPSLMEGFGLPVLESLQRGRPCICSSQGALGESARPGGALMVAEPTSAALADAISSLLQDPPARDQLASVARSRTYRSGSDYTTDLLAWMATLG